jgi:hypothetical protein
MRAFPHHCRRFGLTLPWSHPASIPVANNQHAERTLELDFTWKSLLQHAIVNKV